MTTEVSEFRVIFPSDPNVPIKMFVTLRTISPSPFDGEPDVVHTKEYTTGEAVERGYSMDAVTALVNPAALVDVERLDQLSRAQAAVLLEQAQSITDLKQQVTNYDVTEAELDRVQAEANALGAELQTANRRLYDVIVAASGGPLTE